MHMLSKKDLSSDELDTLRRLRTRTVVLTYSQWGSACKRGRTQGSSELGILPLMQGLIRRIVWLSCRGIKSRKCISINSLILRPVSVGRRASRGIFLFKLSFGNHVVDRGMVIVDSVDDRETSQSIGGERFPYFEMLFSKIASVLKKIRLYELLVKFLKTTFCQVCTRCGYESLINSERLWRTIGNVRTRMKSCPMWTTLSQAQNLLASKPCFTFVRTMER